MLGLKPVITNFLAGAPRERGRDRITIPRIPFPRGVGISMGVKSLGAKYTGNYRENYFSSIIRRKERRKKS